MAAKIKDKLIVNQIIDKINYLKTEFFMNKKIEL